ncbi:MAG: hypothetical protein QXZ44_04795 [Ferroplasma sp.]
MKIRKEDDAKDEKTINLATGITNICSRDSIKIVRDIVMPMKIAGII